MNRFLSLALIAVAGFSLASPALELAIDGRSQAVIVVAPDATEPEKHAAAELAAYLEQITGATYSTSNTLRPGETALLVGPGAARLAEPGFSDQELGAEGFVIRTTKDSLTLAGGRPRGTLYAVYTFLEDQLGCRWWAPDASTIPRTATIRLDKLDTRIIPQLEYREPFWFSAFDGDWAVRNRCNGQAMRLDERRGGKHVIEGFVHTFNLLIPPDKYFKDHPEWFSELEGKRTAERSQLCLSNVPMREELVRNLKQKLEANPAATMASVSQNDWYGSCQCPKCREMDQQEESPAGTMLYFVNAVAEAIEKDFPKVAISTLAYQYTRKPPKTVRPRQNVVVWLCSIECAFNLPLTHEHNAAFRKDIEGWSGICNRLYVWDYTTNFTHYILPHPNLHVLGPNVKFFVEHNVKGLFEQGAYHTWGAEMMELRAWVLAKLLWNPKLDGEKLINEFIDGYYGPAGRHVRAYIDVIHAAAQAAGQPLGCFYGGEPTFLSLQTLTRGLAELRGAEAEIINDGVLRRRVQTSQLPVLYAFLLEWDRLRHEAEQANAEWPVAPTRSALYQEFMGIAAAARVTHVSESRPIGWLKELVKP